MILKRGLLILVLALPGWEMTGAEEAAETQFVDIKKADRTIVIELRYAGPNNVTRRPIYPPDLPALVRPRVAERLGVAQKYLKAKGHGLKIWDAYRSNSAQEKLWQATHNRSFVADPKGGVGSMHTRGAAVDATLVDANGREVAMPSDFDNFTPAALLSYQGNEPQVRANLKLLQKAMAHGGFYGLRTEWWHFCAPEWARYPPAPELNLSSQPERSSRNSTGQAVIRVKLRDRVEQAVIPSEVEGSEERRAGIPGSLDCAPLRSG